jgi:predicted dehydrogenase
MKRYKIAFVGLGSIGKRHFLNVCSLLDARGDEAEIHLYRSDMLRPLDDEFLRRTAHQYAVADALPDDAAYDIVFVTNPTSLHYDTLKKFAHHSRAFFIEKPVFDATDVDESLFTELKDAVCYVACPLRYNPVLKYIRTHVACSKALAVRAMSSSYLPDWRPGQDYRKCYSAHRDMGGGVGIDLIHEWDYLTALFGMPRQVFSIQDQISQLEIDSDDIAIYIGCTDTTTIELHLDYFGRKAQRTLDIFLPDESLHADLINGRVEYMKEGRTVHFDSKRNAYQLEEIRHFFDVVDGVTPTDSSAEHAYQVLKLTKGIIQ